MVMTKSYKETLKGRDFLTLADYSKAEISYLLELSKRIKQKRKNGEIYEPLKGKTLGMIFEKSSTRTRVSFEAGIYQLGGTGLFLSSNDIQIGRGELISDTAKVLSGYLDGIMIRTFAQKDVEDLAENASIPVINGLTDVYHPCQVLADLQTIQEVKGSLEGLKLAYIGDGNNMAHSLMIGAAKMGIDVAIAAPKEYQPLNAVTELATGFAENSQVVVTEDVVEAVANADVIYSDVWASMGQEAEQAKREKAFATYQVNKELFSHANKDAIFMHCLPAHRGEEVTADIIDGPQSVVFQEAENRLHAQKALMVALMG
ncbi:ornithine carbamoyltransferase [Saliterribacillus persicus]|uniref:Ornithine carbamoyltransferase n=1 Tax=Saliterribacillus persicus TaxID=930114 RepID=A0A368XYK2_9BACI|nr:ornithine carbamoyltransferase [Saliterribacillus persicus]RCW73081.1 ornithine carbamoyltransferase [Saliterribacillus persicus]